MEFVTNKFKSGGLHEKHVVATWSLGKHLSIYINGRYNYVLKFTFFIFKMHSYTSLSYANNFYAESRYGGVSNIDN